MADAENQLLYETDFFEWSREQAELSREGLLELADVDHIAEQIESLGRTEKRELVSRLTVLLMHLLKWRFQPEKHSARGEATIQIQRNRLVDHLDGNPSLKPLLPQALISAYRDAQLEAAAGTGLSAAAFPQDCPWTVDRAPAPGFWQEP